MQLNQLLVPGKNNIDIFRLIAALLVIYGHAPAFVPNAVSGDIVARLLGFDYSGSLAVKFFFMLSGLLVTNSLMARPQFIEFLIKRSTRIFPGLIVCVFITTFIVGAFFTQLKPVDYLSHPDVWKYFIHNSFLYELQWFLPGVFTESQHSINGSLWTLPLEFVCYLFLGAFFVLGVWRNTVFATIVLLCIVGLSFFVPHFLPPIFANNKESNLLAGCFALGALFATHKNAINITATGLLALGVLTALLWTSPLKVLVFYLFAFYGCLYLSGTSVFVKNFNIGADPSYGVYIYGFVIQQTLAHMLPGHSVLFNQVFSALIAIAIGFLSWFWVEKPSISFVKKLIEQGRNGIIMSKSNSSKPRKILSYLSGKNLLIFVGLVLGAWMIHFFSLYFIFPGYYNPLSFHHSDFYIPAAFAYSANEAYSFTNLLSWPRPFFMWFYKFTGYFGYAGSIAWVVAIVFVNCALTTVFFKRVLELKADLKFFAFFAIYCFILFTQPYFYTFYSQDIASQLSYFLLLSGSFLFYNFVSRNIYFAAALLCACSISAFLVKETYILSFGFIAFCWFVLYVKKDLMRALAPGVAIFLAAVIAAFVNFKTKSVFVNLEATQGSDYHINLNVLSILKELSRYAGEAMTPLIIIGLGLVSFLVYKQDKSRMLLIGFVICLVFAILAWLPNALLPFHHYPGYSFNGLYVCFASIFILLKLVQDEKIAKKLFWATVILLMISPLSSIKTYKNDRNQWVLIMEGIQRNMLKGFQQATGQLLAVENKKPVAVLITGITSPFHPFVFPESIRSFPGGDRATYYFVVPNEYPARLGEKVDLVQYISDADKASVVVDQEWQFDKDGKLVSVLKK